MGFETLHSWPVSLYKRSAVAHTKDRKTLPLETCVPSDAELNAAIALDAAACPRAGREELLEAMMRGGAMCAVVRRDGVVAAAAWGREMGRDGSGGRGLFLGPVVAATSQLAECVVEHVFRQFADFVDGVPFDISVLALRNGGGGSAPHLFESFGFVEQFDMPYMFKSLMEGTQSAAYPPPASQYFSLAGYSLG